MGRLLFWILLGIVAWAGMKHWTRVGVRRGRREGGSESAAESMVRCEVCGLNVPESDALSRGGRWFCSREHLEGRQSGS
jgi:uncharacterized protein